MRLTIGFGLCLVLALAAAPGVVGEMAHPMLGEAAPDFRLSTLDGESVGLADYRGKTVVLHFGASW
jgi:cytochrome oxidase Cu insertion factor (SCO1/SenC/PrrC family)